MRFVLSVSFACMLLGAPAPGHSSAAGQSAVVSGPGGGEYVVGPQDHISEDQRRRIKKDIERNILTLRAEGAYSVDVERLIREVERGFRRC